MTVSGASATAVVSQYVANIPVTSAGTGYNSAPTIALSGGGTTLSGTLTSGLAVVAGLSSTAGLVLGMGVSGTGVPGGRDYPLGRLLDPGPPVGERHRDGERVARVRADPGGGRPDHVGRVGRPTCFTYTAPAAWLERRDLFGELRRSAGSRGVERPDVELDRAAGGVGRRHELLRPGFDDARGRQHGPLADQCRLVHEYHEELVPSGVWLVVLGAGILTYGPDNATPASWTSPGNSVLRAAVY